MFGLAEKRPDVSARSAVDVSLDDLIAMRAEVARDRHASQLGITHLPGLARTRLRGRGLDFDEMRPYAEGDDVRHIDWNVTARTGRPHTRLYREERERAVTVALDLRGPMFTGSQRLKAVVAAEAAAAILWRVAANRDRAGAIVFDDHEIVHSRPASRERGVLDALALVSRVATGNRPDDEAPRMLDGVLAEINRLGRGAGLVILITGCDDRGAAYADELAIAGSRDRLVVLRLADPLELEAPPPGAYSYRAGGKTARANLTSAGRTAVNTALSQANRGLEDLHAAANVPYLSVSTTRPATELWSDLVANGIL